jgi:FkbM family methyltransferase
VSTQTFVSHGQNREDVVLWRALSAVGVGRYVEVGGNDPVIYSITRSFYDRGWAGLVVEPEPQFAAQQRAQRPRDVLVEAAITSSEGPVVLQRFAGTGLSTLDASIGQGHEESGFERDELSVPGKRLDTVLAEHGFDRGDVHFLVVDVEGLEADVLSTVDLASWRPWILVVEATRPLSDVSTHDEWEPGVLASGYQFCLFDGVSRFYVAQEHAEGLGWALSHPACALDDFIDADRQHLMERAARYEGQVLRWRRAALETWAIASAESHMGAVQEVARLRRVVGTLRKRVRVLSDENAQLRHRLIKPKVKRAAKALVRRVR